MTSARIGYARSYASDEEVPLETLERELLEVGCTKLFIEQKSSPDGVRPDMLEAALEYLRQEDTLVVATVNRLSHSLPHFIESYHRIRAKDASLSVIDIDLDSRTADGKLALKVLSAFAARDRSTPPCFQRTGTTVNKVEKTDPPSKLKAKDLKKEIRSLRAEGHGASKIAKLLGISKGSVYDYWDEEE